MGGALRPGHPAAPPPRHPPPPPPPPPPTLSPYSASSRKSKLKRVDRQRLIVILVGLPARGKTFLCNKLMNYLNW